MPKRRANETVRNWFNEVGRSWRCARDEQYELLKRGRTSERARASERAREEEREVEEAEEQEEVVEEERGDGGGRVARST